MILNFSTNNNVYHKGFSVSVAVSKEIKRVPKATCRGVRKAVHSLGKGTFEAQLTLSLILLVS